MKLKVIILAIVLVVIAGIFLIINRSVAPTSENIENNIVTIDDVKKNQTESDSIEQNLPWIEVVVVSVYKKQGESWQDLKTGDQLKNGDIVKTDDSGLANIYMPDGSVARLDSGTEIVITQADYEEAPKTIKVQIKLIAGRIWSKIVELSTNESYWEVETANAVAAVRGTAFGVEYENDETMIVGWENTVEVQSIDMYSGKKSNPVLILANKVLRINETTARTSEGASEEIFEDRVEDLSPEVKSSSWIERAISADTALFGIEEPIIEEGNSLERSVDQTSDNSIELLDVSAPTLNQR